MTLNEIRENDTVAVGYAKPGIPLEYFYGSVASVVPATVGHDARLTLHVGIDDKGKKAYRSFLESRITSVKPCIMIIDLASKVVKA